MSGAPIPRTIGAFVVLVCAVGLFSWSIADASATVTAGGLRCTITSRQPTLSATLRLGGSVMVSCNAATTIGLEMTVVELDGTAEDGITEVPLQVRWAALTANTPMLMRTTRVTCLSTEAGGEEFATRARLNISGTLSPWDRTAPAVDAYAC